MNEPAPCEVCLGIKLRSTSSELPLPILLVAHTILAPADVDELSKAPLSPSGSSRLPPEAKPDVVMTQARLLRKVTPEDVSTMLNKFTTYINSCCQIRSFLMISGCNHGCIVQDEDKELLAWLAQRGFYDMVALQYM
jgi:hypothetical protein